MASDDDDARRPGSIGNQNARRHGWYSKVDPPSKQELMQAAQNAIEAEDHVELRAIGRAMGFHGRRTDDDALKNAGRNVIRLAGRLEVANAEKESEALLEQMRKQSRH